MAGEKITVLCAGAGGCTLAFHLTQVGYDVLLYQDVNHTMSVQKLLDTSEIIAYKQYDGCQSHIYGNVKISAVTSNIKEALKFSKILMLTVPALAQLHIFKSALPYLTKEHIFISMPGNNAIFDYVEEINKSNIKITNPVAHIKDIPMPCVFAECSTLPYVCRKLQENEIFVGNAKEFIYIGVFPSFKTDSILKILNPIFKNLSIGLEKKDILEVIFYNPNMILHPVTIVYNAGRIQNLNNDFRLYRDGVSPSVIKIIEGVDKEILSIGKSLGFTLESFSSFYKRYYADTSDKSLLNFFREASFLHFAKAPTDLKGRLISEDFEYVLIPIIEFLARKQGIVTPISNAIIESVNCMVGRKLTSMRRIPDDVLNDILKQNQTISQL